MVRGKSLRQALPRSTAGELLHRQDAKNAKERQGNGIFKM